MTAAKPTEALSKLREDFPAEVIGKLPRVTCKACSNKACGNENHKPRKCDGQGRADRTACNGWLSPAHIHIDFVGHAHVTDRLLSADPEWTWEPLAFDPQGLPLVTRNPEGHSVLWIRLAVAGVTRLGVGTAPAGGFEVEKQLIGDAIRNAAMRFGVALTLWAKADLESSLAHETAEPPPSAPPARQERAPSAPPAARPAKSIDKPKRVAAGWVREFMARANDLLVTREELHDLARLVTEGRTDAVSALHEDEADEAIAHLDAIATERAAEQAS